MYREKFNLDGRVAVVTGSAQGIGNAIAAALSEHGATVVIADLDEKNGAAAAGALKCEFVPLDVRDRARVRMAAGEIVARHGRVDILVNNAGIARNSPSVDTPPEEWLEVIDVNLNGVFICCREVAPHMRAANYGRIVNIASVAGKDGNPNASAYSASKAAVMALTKSLGKELASTGVRVNCVTPAAVKTAIFDQMTPEHIAFMLSKIPMARFGTPEEVASLVGWLCTEDCSFSTGAVFDLSGGRSTY